MAKVLSCVEKIKEINLLFRCITHTTKCEATGRFVSYQKEIKQTARVLEVLLGRKPTPEEVELARIEVWPKESKGCCKK